MDKYEKNEIRKRLLRLKYNLHSCYETSREALNIFYSLRNIGFIFNNWENYKDIFVPDK